MDILHNLKLNYISFNVNYKSVYNEMHVFAVTCHFGFELIKFPYFS